MGGTRNIRFDKRDFSVVSPARCTSGFERKRIDLKFLPIEELVRGGAANVTLGYL